MDRTRSRGYCRTMVGSRTHPPRTRGGGYVNDVEHGSLDSSTY